MPSLLDIPPDDQGATDALGALYRAVIGSRVPTPIWPADNPVGTENLQQQYVSNQQGGFDPAVDPSVAHWPGRPMTQSEYEGMRSGSLGLFGQAAMAAGSPAAEEGAAAGVMGRRSMPTEPGPSTDLLGLEPKVWAPQPYSVAPIYSRSSVASRGERTWAVKDYDGQKVGSIDTTWNPDTGNLHVDSIDSQGGPNTMGTAAVRQLRSSLLGHYPEAKTLTGLRISGATYHDRGGGIGAGRNAIQYVQPNQ